MRKPKIELTVLADEDGVNEFAMLVINAVTTGKIIVSQSDLPISDAFLEDLEGLISLGKRLAKELGLKFVISKSVTDFIDELKTPENLPR